MKSISITIFSLYSCFLLSSLGPSLYGYGAMVGGPHSLGLYHVPSLQFCHALLRHRIPKFKNDQHRWRSNRPR